MRGFEIKIDCSELGLGGFVVNELKTGKGPRTVYQWTQYNEMGLILRGLRFTFKFHFNNNIAEKSRTTGVLLVPV